MVEATVFDLVTRPKLPNDRNRRKSPGRDLVIRNLGLGERIGDSKKLFFYRGNYAQGFIAAKNNF